MDGDGDNDVLVGMLIILISVVCVLLLLLLGAFAWWAKTGKPLSQIPVLSQETPPHYTTAVYDVSKPLGVAVDETNNRLYVTQTNGPRTVAVFDLDGNPIGELKPGAKRERDRDVGVARPDDDLRLRGAILRQRVGIG